MSMSSAELQRLKAAEAQIIALQARLADLEALVTAPPKKGK